MARRRFSKGSSLTIACLFLIFTSLNSPTATSAQTSPEVSRTPAVKIESKEKKPNPVRRFFSGVVKRIAGVFRRPQMHYCVLPPFVDIRASSTVITFCPTTRTYSTSPQISLWANALTPEDGAVVFNFTVTGGRLSDNKGGKNVTWDLEGVPEGVYTATVEMSDGHEHVASTSTNVKVALTPDCERPPPPCPAVSVSVPNDVTLVRPITFEANVTGGDPEMKPTYTWSISAGKIISGQGTPKLTVDGSNLGRETITATVSLGGAHPLCSGTTASATLPIAADTGSSPVRPPYE
jgi:hypothetical protein